LETPMLPAGLNVRPMQSVHLAKHVKTCIVLTLVQQQIVESMPSVKWSITFPTVSAYRDILETLSLHVANHHLSLNQLKLKIPAIQILVDQTAILQDRLETDVTVHVSQR
jgi:D-serine deaminase-like pyridoxal phosphate-dependent protein